MRAKFKITKENIKVQFSINRPQIPAVFKINAAGANWGSIRGNIENQIDLQNALNQKADLNYVENEFTTIDNRLESLEDTIPVLEGEINQKPDRDELSPVAFSGDYNDLSIKPIIGNGTLTLLQNGDFVGDFKANATNNKTWNIDIPTKLSQLENDIADIDVEQVNNAIERHNQSEDAHRYIQGRIVQLDDKYTIVTEMLNSEIANANDRITSNANNITIVNNNLTALEQLVNENYDTLNGNILETAEQLSNDLLATSNSLNIAIEQEAMSRESADNNLQSQIDSITAASDVVAIVGTYAELLQYDTATLNPNDIVKVLNDEIHENASSYYRWTGSAWVYIGSEGPFYTKSEANSTFVPQTRTINNKALTNNINLTASDVKALPDTTVIGNGNLTVQKNGVNIANFSANETTNVVANISVPTSVSELTNDANYVTSNQLETGLNTKQDKLIAGTGIEITAENVINSTAVTEWGEIQGELSNQEDLQTALDSKVGISNDETITGAKTFTKPLTIQNGAGTGSLIVGGDVNAGTVTNGTRKLARVAVPTQTNVNLKSILLGFDSNGDAALKVTNKTYDAVSFGGQTKITNATSPMSIGFCVAKTRNATAASDKIYPLELDSTEARFNVQPNFNGDDLVTKTELETKQNKLTAGNNIVIENDVISAVVEVQGGEKYGIKGDYSTHYGIEYCQYGLIETTVGSNTVVVKGGMVLVIPGAETKTTIASDISYTIENSTDLTLFYADGEIIEALDVYYSLEEPTNGTEGFIAWFNPEVGLWQFKSNATGNVWRTANATPLADVKYGNGNIVRIDYIGYRILNDDIYALKSDVPDVSEIYTKSETDTLLDKKQGLLTPNDPIKLIEVTLSNSFGYTYNDDGTMQPNAGESWGLSSNVATVGLPYNNYIDFPLDLDNANNRFVMYPSLMTDTGAITYACQALGKLDSDGNFYPIIILNPVGNDYNANSSRYWVANSLLTENAPVTMSTKQGSTAASSTTNNLNTGDSVNPNVVAFGFQKASSTKINITSTYSTYTQTISVTKSLVNEINCFRVLNRNSGINGIVKPEFIGLFQGSSTVATNGNVLRQDVKNALDGLLTNEVDIASFNVINKLELEYDNTLEINDNGELSVNLDIIATSANLETKQDKLTAGENITIENNVISATASMPIGTIYTLNCTDSYVPEGNLPCDGTEYTRAQFSNLWDNYLNTTGQPLLNTCTYAEYEQELAIYGQCEKFAVNTKITPISSNTALTITGNYTGDVNDVYTYIYNGENSVSYDSNVIFYGECDDNNGIISNFSEDNNVNIGNTIIYSPKIYFTTDTDVTTRQILLTIYGTYTYNIGIANGKLFFDDTVVEATIQPETEYYLALRYSSTGLGYYDCYLYLSSDELVTIIGTVFMSPTSSHSATFGVSFLGILNLVKSYYLSENRVFYADPIIVSYWAINNVQTDMSLYGITIKGKPNNGDIITFEEQGTFRVPTAKKLERFLIDKKEPTDSDPSWYNVYSDGWCEQGSYLETSATGTVTINLLKDLANTDYSIQLTEAHTGVITDARTVNKANKTTSSFQIFRGSTAIPIYWEACGYIDIASYPVPKKFVVVANGSINQSMMDWSAWASSLQGKADKTGLDGQYVISQLQLASDASTSTTDTEYDLSTYLPDDSYTYDVLFTGYVIPTDTKQRLSTILLKTDIVNNEIFVCASRCEVAGVEPLAYGSIWLPVGLGRKAIVAPHPSTYFDGTYSLRVEGYRRVGTNE